MLPGAPTLRGAQLMLRTIRSPSSGCPLGLSVGQRTVDSAPLRSQAPVSDKTTLECRGHQLPGEAGLSARRGQSLRWVVSPGDRVLRHPDVNEGLVAAASSSDVSLGAAGDEGHDGASGLRPEAPLPHLLRAGPQAIPAL